MTKRRIPKAGQRLKIGGKRVEVPGVASMTDAHAAEPREDKRDKPADELPEEKYKPFCSKRCADIDLGRWLKESYRVPTDEGPGEEEPKTRSEEGG